MNRERNTGKPRSRSHVDQREHQWSKIGDNQTIDEMFDSYVTDVQETREVSLILVRHQKHVELGQLLAFGVRIIFEAVISEDVLDAVVGLVE